MISEILKTIVDKFKEQGEMDFFEGTTEEKINIFEAENKIKLPTKYREWLLFSDGGELFLPVGVQLYGVEHKPVIDISDNSRPCDDYVVIGTFPTGDPILCKKTDDTISVYIQENGEIDEDLVYPDFVAFLNDLYELLGLGE
ncbi:hypothetical protein IMM1_15640 [Pseudocoprococcus immobilis]